MMRFNVKIALTVLLDIKSLTKDSPMANSYTSIKKVMLVREGSLKGRPFLTSTSKTCAFFKQYWEENSTADQERFVVACLNAKLQVQAVVVITTGTVDASLVSPREVFKPAIIEGSCGIVVSHNHPSGNVTPSKEDWTVFDVLSKAGKLLGITIYDSIIYGDDSNDVLSMKEEEWRRP